MESSLEPPFDPASAQPVKRLRFDLGKKAGFEASRKVGEEQNVPADLPDEVVEESYSYQMSKAVSERLTEIKKERMSQVFNGLSIFGFASLVALAIFAVRHYEGPSPKWFGGGDTASNRTQVQPVADLAAEVAAAPNVPATVVEAGEVQGEAGSVASAEDAAVGPAATVVATANAPTAAAPKIDPAAKPTLTLVEVASSQPANLAVPSPENPQLLPAPGLQSAGSEAGQVSQASHKAGPDAPKIEVRRALDPLF